MAVSRERTAVISLVVCAVLALFWGAPGVTCSQPSLAPADTIQFLRVQIRSLEERIRALEAQSAEVAGKDTTAGQASRSPSLESELASLAEEIEALKLALDVQQERIARVKVAGEERVRFMNIDTHGARAIGAYGEELKQESTFKHYLRLEIRASVSKNIIAGARLRMTNVSKDVLNLGPEYLSQEYGSAFLRYARKEFNCIVGAYDVHLTPFTLMRWDEEDNPEGGGEAGGGCLVCGGVAGAIPRESLEELTPTLSFEGARLNGMIQDMVDLVVFYARPRIAGSRQYRQHLFGARAKLLSYHRASTSFRHVGLTIVTTRDEASSSDYPSLSGPALANNVLGVDLAFPITEGFLLRGEWAYSESDVDSVGGSLREYDGHSLLFGVKYHHRDLFRLRCSYLRVGEFFESSYSAVSYKANRHGVRSSLTFEIPRWKSSLSSFAKVLREIEPIEPGADDDQLQTFYTASVGISVAPVENVLIRPSVIYRGTRRDEGEVLDKVKDNTYLLILEFVFTLFRDNEFILRYQKIDSEDKVDPSRDYGAETVFSLFSLKF